MVAYNAIVYFLTLPGSYSCIYISKVFLDMYEGINDRNMDLQKRILVF